MSEGAADGRPHPHTNWRTACLLAAMIIAVLEKALSQARLQHRKAA